MKTKLDFKKVGTFFKNAYHKIGKKNLIVIAAILVIGGAVYVNYLLFSDPVGIRRLWHEQYVGMCMAVLIPVAKIRERS